MFLISILSALPPTGKTTADPAIEALNAIFDVYADAEFDYDEQVFVMHNFLDHLITIVPKVKAMVGYRPLLLYSMLFIVYVRRNLLNLTFPSTHPPIIFYSSELYTVGPNW